MSADEPLLRLESVARRFGGGPDDFHLGPVSIEVRSGDWWAVTGRSGSGKTTLLNLMAGLDRPDAGRLWMFGAEVTRAAPGALSELRRDGIGFVYQEAVFLERLPVWQNVACRLVPQGVAAGERHRRAQALLDEYGVGHTAERRPGSLSGGEKQRVALARARIGEPRVLFADEPTSGVDAETAGRVIASLAELRGRGTALVVSSHDPAVVAAAESRLALGGAP